MLNEICQVFKEAYKRGWITTRDGNASFRRPESDWFYVTPSGVRKQELIPEMCIKLDISQEGTSRDRWLQRNEGMLKQRLNRGLEPTGELPMHHLLQRNIPGEHPRVVLHLHPTHVIAMTRWLLRKMENPQQMTLSEKLSLQDLALEYPEIFRYTRVGHVIGYIEPISQALGEAVALEMVNADGSLKCDVIGLDRHGAVSIGTDPWEAFEHMERLNHICEIALLAR